MSGLISPFPCQYPKVSVHLHAVSCLCWWRPASSAKSIITIYNKTMTQHFQWHGLTVALAQHHVFTEPHPKAGIPNLVFPCIYSIIHRISATLEGTTLSIPLRHPFKTEFESVNALNMFSIRSSTEQVQTKQLGIYRCPRIIQIGLSQLFRVISPCFHSICAIFSRTQLSHSFSLSCEPTFGPSAWPAGNFVSLSYSCSAKTP